MAWGRLPAVCRGLIRFNKLIPAQGTGNGLPFRGLEHGEPQRAGEHMPVAVPVALEAQASPRARTEANHPGAAVGVAGLTHGAVLQKQMGGAAVGLQLLLRVGSSAVRDASAGVRRSTPAAGLIGVTSRTAMVHVCVLAVAAFSRRRALAVRGTLAEERAQALAPRVVRVALLEYFRKRPQNTTEAIHARALASRVLGCQVREAAAERLIEPVEPLHHVEPSPVTVKELQQVIQPVILGSGRSSP